MSFGDGISGSDSIKCLTNMVIINKLVRSTNPSDPENDSKVKMADALIIVVFRIIWSIL
jgi:hypothetical protein